MNSASPNLVPRECSRRGFLKTCASGLALGYLGGTAALASEEGDPPDGLSSAVLVDLTRCIGCRSCENACRVRQGRSTLPVASFGYGAGEGRLSFTSWTFVDFREVAVEGNRKTRFPVKRQCMHCANPACVSACPVAALHKTPRGSVVYREDRCMGCRYCMVACPFNIPRYEWNEGLTPRVGKCDFCDDRVASGLAPACATVCPTGALKFGKRKDILRESIARLSTATQQYKSIYGEKTEPARYVSIYGDKVVGGTSWIYLSDVPMEKLGFRTDLPEYSLPLLTWKVLAKVPVVVVSLGLILSAIYRFRRRKAHA